ncbi:undecaprenyl-phosphate glucose phosphotransferase, partial [Fibrobacterales bacterium]|nr:undecaprenyl-phosphate glucose phosphotransferase [Fibrobacterales bacterium]
GILERNETVVSVANRIVDGLLILAAFFVTATWFLIPWQGYLLSSAAISMAVYLIIADFFGLYTSWRGRSIWSEFFVVIRAWLLSVFALAPFLHLTDTQDLMNRKEYLFLFVLIGLILSFGRVVIRNILRYARRFGYNHRKVAIVGASNLGKNLAQRIVGAPWTGVDIIGFFDDKVNDFPRTIKFKGKEKSEVEIPVLGALADIKNFEKEFSTIYIALPMKNEKKILDLVESLADSTLTVHIVPDVFMFELLHAKTHNLNGMPTISIHDTPHQGYAALVKRIEDFVLASIILTLITPILFVVALAVKFSSKGPVIFKQNRYGIDGKPIKVYKFRSMTATDNGDKVVQATKGDMRITKVGGFLRRTSLDELPQFVNVLQGRMSIVGPRPHAVAHNEEYRKLIQGYMLRHKVKPGITGWAQVNGWRGETDTLEKMEKRIEFDLDYIRNWSVSFDLRIIFFTIFKGFVGKNAY